MEQLRSEKFDLGITEYFDYCGLALFTRIQLDKFVAVYISPLTQIAAGSYGLGSVTSYVPGRFFGVLRRGFCEFEVSNEMSKNLLNLSININQFRNCNTVCSSVFIFGAFAKFLWLHALFSSNLSVHVRKLQ